jgi:hypothetical protein
MIKRLLPSIPLTILLFVVLVSAYFDSNKPKIDEWISEVAYGALQLPNPPHGEGMIVGTVTAMKFYGLKPPSIPSINIPDISKERIVNEINLKEQEKTEFIHEVGKEQFREQMRKPIMK